MIASKTDVLVVEDDPVINRLLCAILNQEGYQCRPALQGSAAIREAEQCVPSIVVLDIMLPDFDGFEVCRRLKKDQRTAEVPVIMVTALADDQNREKGLSCGAAAYLPKPFNPSHLIATIEHFTRGRRTPIEETGA